MRIVLSSIPTAQHRVIYKLRELLGVDEMGGTMRLGSWPCVLPARIVRTAKAYGKLEITERHRHRYEFNREYEKILTDAGFQITGKTPDGTYVEIVEAPEHPWFVGCQFHPEFKSKPLAPDPLFAAFVGASVKHRNTDKVEASSSAGATDSTASRQAAAAPVAADSVAGDDAPAANAAAASGNR